MRALVIGASAGVGREVAIHLGQLGAELVIVGRRRQRLDAVAAEVGTATVVVADVAEPEACRSIVDQAVAALGELDLIVHAAGVSDLAPLRVATPAQWRAVLHTNVIAPALIAGAALGHLSEAAVVSFLSSEAVADPHHGLVPYAASKAALETTIRGLRVEHPEVRFCCVRIGVTGGTEFARDFDPDLATELFPKWIEAGQIPAQMMNPTELGRTIADALHLAVRSTGLDVQDLVIRAPGDRHRGATTFLVDTLEQASAARSETAS
jgi:NAD(P)-dependent dehydrogenase (short-subunit alcohol dehydrogenase family)